MYTAPLHKQFKTEAWLMLALLAVTGYVYVQSLTLPAMTLSKLLFVRNTVSVWSSINSLYTSQEWLLFALIFTFTIITPICKMLSILQQWWLPGGKRASMCFGLLHRIGKWAMLDVFVVALLLVSIKLGALADLHLHAGVYWFIAAILLLWILSGFTHYYRSRLGFSNIL